MLAPGRQLGLALGTAPFATLRLRARSFIWLLIYLAASAVILTIVGKLIVAHRKDLIGLVVGYVFPSDWRAAGEMLVERFFAAQERAVLANAAIAGSLLIVQLTLFPVKEALSSAFERDAKLLAEPIDEYPLWFQAWEEIKLALVFVAAQGTIFWLGYSQDPTRKTIALVLSYGVLFASVAADFLAPVLQRHRLRYSAIVKTLIANPLLSLVFGAVFALPPILASMWTARHPDLSLSAVLGVQFGVQVVAIALAAVGGTAAGAALLADTRVRKPSSLPVRLGSWGLLVALLAWNVYRFGAVGQSLHHKSQILKCTYDVDWASIGVDRPSAIGLIGAISSDAIEVGIHFDVTITNPTQVDVDIEDNHLDIAQKDQLVAQTRLPRLHVPAGGSERARVSFPLTLKPSQLTRIRELITTKDWSLTLWLHVAAGFDFPIYLVTRT